MSIKKIDGELFKNMIISGAANLKANYQTIDALNVFPVPDGDTGTNMKMTIDGGVNEIYNFHDKSIQEVGKKLSRGMLMGARGNSGVILSQLFRGIASGFVGFEQVDAMLLAKAFQSGVNQAYKAVMKPVEGTILTVAREASEKMIAISSSRMSINEFFDEYIAEAQAALNRTPELLPVLKESGVVDSGGAGFVCILLGMYKALDGDVNVTLPGHSPVDFKVTSYTVNKKTEAEFGYCTEFLLQLPTEKVNINEDQVYENIKSLGDSIVVVKDEDIIKVHIHSLTPGQVLNEAQKYGEFIHLKIENMTIQHNENKEITHVEEGACSGEEVHAKAVTKPAIRKKYAIVAVASGEGLMKTFRDLGVDAIVPGGQSMNPSTEDFIRSFDTINADNIIVFPNNKNIILAANQAAKIYEESKVHVIETKSLAQGFSALTMIDLNGTLEEIIQGLKTVIDNVTTGLITYSVRDTQVEGLSIKKDDFIGICDNKIVTSSRRRNDAVKKLLKHAVSEQKEIVTIIYGEGISKRELNDITLYIEKNFDVEIDVIEGNQEVYSYILAIE